MKDRFESFYFTIDDWSRAYRFEINRHPWEFDPDHHSERDEIFVAGRLRTKSKRKISAGEAWISPSHIPRDQLDEEAERIGNAWVKNGRLYCSAFIPANTYWSLCSCLAAEKFLEMSIRVKNLRYSKGSADAIRLEPELSILEPDECTRLPANPVQVCRSQ